MLIEFTDDFINQLNKMEYLDNVWLLLNNILHNTLHYHHIVFATIQGIEMLLGSNEIDNSNKKVLGWIKNKIQDLNALKNKVKIILRLSFVSSSKKQEDNKTIYYLNVYDVDEFKESVFVTENPSDYDFYLKIAKWFLNFNNYDISISNSPSCGSNAEQVIISNNKEEKFVYCLFDSDRDSLNAKAGDTYKNAKKGANKRVNKNYPFQLDILEAREKENLFPFTQYINDTKIGKKERELLKLIQNESEEIQKFFDIKDGIKKKRIRDKRYQDWQAIYFDFIQKCEKMNLCDICNCQKDSCRDCKDSDEEYIHGIGDKILQRVSDNFFEKYDKKITNIEIIDKIFGNQHYILLLWQSIADVIFSFGCCLSRSIKFVN